MRSLSLIGTAATLLVLTALADTGLSDVSLSGESGHWVALRTVEGVRRIEITHDATYASTALRMTLLYDSSGTLIYASRTALHFGSPQVHVSAIEGLVEATQPSPASELGVVMSTSWGCETCDPLPIDHTLVVVFEGDIHSWAMSTSAIPDSRVPTSWGDDTFHMTSADFGSTASAVVSASGPLVRAAVGTRAVELESDTLVAYFSGSIKPPVVFRERGPAGPTECPCYHLDPGTTVPGTYLYDLADVDGAARDVYLVGATVNFP